jgi:phospholipid/cholesterol/gamma-HCH transport system substrate-binding protein
VLAHIGDRDDQLSDLIVSFRNLVGGLTQDRQAILSWLDSISQLSVLTASLIAGIRPSFVSDIAHLRAVAKTLDDNKAEINRALQVLPIKLTKVGRTATYGSWFNFYLCQFTGRVVVANQAIPVDYQTNSTRCNLG